MARFNRHITPGEGRIPAASKCANRDEDVASTNAPGRSGVPAASKSTDRDEDVASTNAPGRSGVPGPSERNERDEDVASTDAPGRSGVPAASKESKRDETGTTTFLLGTFDPNKPVGHIRGGNLPHWRQDGATYFVTWRTADSMPKDRVDLWMRERVAWIAQNPEPWSDAQQREYSRRFTARWEKWLDELHGQCLLRRGDLRSIVESALKHFDRSHYSLGEFVVMPNHVHVMVTPLSGYELSEIVGAWKSFTAHKINKSLGRKGEFWQKESFDHIVRDAESAERFAAYIRDNPRRCGISNASE